MSIAAPVSMLAGKGSGPALLVVGLLVALAVAQRAAQQTTPAKPY